MASIINASSTGSGGIVQTADASGVLQLQSNGTVALTVSGATVTLAGATTLSSTLQVATTIGVGGATPAASGAGITFPATESASSNANTLDDYEEGTWTPTLSADTTAPTVSSFTQRTGTYVKVGSIVIVTCTVRANLSTTGTGGALITGLPFASAGYLDGVALGIRDLLDGVNPSYSYVTGASVSFSVGYRTGVLNYITFTVAYRVA
jgi:hypothetical protein